MLNKRLITAWALSVPVSYAALGFLDMYYTTRFEILLVTLLVHTLASLTTYFLLNRLARQFQKNPINAALALAVTVATFLFFAGLVNMASQFPRLFDISAYVLLPETRFSFLAGLAVALPVSFLGYRAARRANIQQTRFYRVVDENLAGMVIAAIFFGVYFLLASIFNQPVFRFDDIFFDTDSVLYRQRFGTELYKDYYERTVHPYVLILVRPWVWIISLFLKGDTMNGAIILTALSGAMCVFLIWYFVKNSRTNSLYAMLIAVLFGASAAHIIFSSLIENYIFLALTALIYMVLLLKNSPMYALVITGLAAFGVTISNIAQTVIAYFMVKRNIPQLIKYGLIVGALIVPLNLLNNFIYPGAHPYLWAVETLQYEEKNVFEPTFQRANFLGRVMLLHSFVSPDPLLESNYNPILRVWMFRAALKKAPLEIARYETDLGNVLVAVWLVLVAVGGLLFLKNLFKQDNGFSFAFILIALFSFVLHMRYGRDVFLYSANWTYAITLFLALAWKELSDKRWFQVSLLTFVSLLMINNSRLILLMLWSSWMHTR
jgi:hypothetical protein